DIHELPAKVNEEFAIIDGIMRTMA
ncbi:MAG: hypothetical protein JWP02_1242, partial [Acidimicrobiales bacterium]|nr:hypothetical protein [Acidimicrobiales bacterium]